MNDILDETEVAQLLDCEPRTVQEKARTGELPAVKFGRSWRFPRSALLQSLHELALKNSHVPQHEGPKAVAVPAANSKPSRRRTLPTLVGL